MDSKKNKSYLWIKGIIIFIVVIALWCFSWYYIDNYIIEENRGTFGDKFGAVNALFSGLAFAGLIITLLYQKEELKLQREELNGQKKEFEEQNKTLKRQRFENTFFNMLSLQQEIVSNLSYEWIFISNYHFSLSEVLKPTKTKNTYNGREVFEAIFEYVDIENKSHSKYRNGIRNYIESFGIDDFVNIISLSRFDHYFRHLYHIFKYVDTSDLIEDDERYDYTSIIRSQLSDYELVMLFYNCLSENGKDKFKPLIEKYTVFNNLRDDLLVKSEHKVKYKESAYNRNI
jgi:hypothetical protein